MAAKNEYFFEDKEEERKYADSIAPLVHAAALAEDEFTLDELEEYARKVNGN